MRWSRSQRVASGRWSSRSWTPSATPPPGSARPATTCWPPTGWPGRSTPRCSPTPDPRRPANSARFVYLDPASKEFFIDWERAADDIAAMLRSEAGRNPHDRALTQLIGELSTQSEVFRTRWAAHDVRFHRTGVKRLHHPAVGDLELNFEAMELPSHPGLTMLVYTANPGSSTADALQLLASWAATQDESAHST